MSDVIVSVLIPAYNAESTLERTVASLFAQTLHSWEAVIVDDASHDRTLQIALELAAKDCRVKVLHTRENRRQSAARNMGLKVATGAWIAILDADDAFLPRRLELLVAAGEDNNLDMVADNQIFFDVGLQQASRLTADPITPTLVWNLETHLNKERLGRSFKWGLLKPIIRHSFLKEVGLCYREQFHMGEDSLLYMESLACGAKATVIPDCMYLYTTSRGELSGQVSSFSTSTYRFDEHISTYDYFGKKYHKLLSSAELKQLEMCKKAAKSYNAYMGIRRCIRDRKIGEAIALSLAEPTFLNFVGVAMLKFVKYKLPYKLRLYRGKSH